MISEPEALIRIVLAAIAGAAIGLDREVRGKPAGLRTNAIVATGAAIFTIIGFIAFGEGEPAARVAAQIVSGIGFLGAGAIIQQSSGVAGLTTAAGIWGAAAVGMAFGAGLYIIGTGATIILLVILVAFGVLEHRAELAAGREEEAGEDRKDSDQA